LDRHPHILNASSNLLGICFVIITGLRITSHSAGTIGDEVAWVAALFFLASIGLPFSGIRRNEQTWRDVWADRVFMGGVAMLTLAIVAIGIELT
jgi:hypothetical protein